MLEEVVTAANKVRHLFMRRCSDEDDDGRG